MHFFMLVCAGLDQKQKVLLFCAGTGRRRVAAIPMLVSDILRVSSTMGNQRSTPPPLVDACGVTHAEVAVNTEWAGDRGRPPAWALPLVASASGSVGSACRSALCLWATHGQAWSLPPPRGGVRRDWA